MNEDPGERTRIYLAKIQDSLQKAEATDDAGVRRLAEHARRYVADAKYFLEAGKPTTALASVAYAEGLLDSLNILSLEHAQRSGKA
jgi:hypothetical protein